MLKDGKLVGSVPIDAVDRNKPVTMMIARNLADIYPPNAQKGEVGEVAVEAKDVGDRVKGMSFEVRKGEVHGMAGMVGAGRTELARAVLGSLPLDGGSVRLVGQAVAKPSPARSVAAGLGFLTEDRKGEGLFMLLDLAANITAPVLDTVGETIRLNRGVEKDIARRQIRLAVPGDARDHRRPARSALSLYAGLNWQHAPISLCIDGGGRFLGVPVNLIALVVLPLSSASSFSSPNTAGRFISSAATSEPRCWSACRQTGSYRLLRALLGHRRDRRTFPGWVCRPGRSVDRQRLRIGLDCRRGHGRSRDHGGRGNVFGALLGALILIVMFNAVILLGLPVQVQLILKGVIVIVASTLYLSGSWERT